MVSSVQTRLLVQNGRAKVLPAGRYGLILLKNIPPMVSIHQVHVLSLRCAKSVRAVQMICFNDHPSTAVIILEDMDETCWLGSALQDVLFMRNVINCNWFLDLDIHVPFNPQEHTFIAFAYWFWSTNPLRVLPIFRAPLWARLEPHMWRNRHHIAQPLQNNFWIGGNSLQFRPWQPSPPILLNGLITEFERFSKLPPELRLSETSKKPSLHLS